MGDFYGPETPRKCPRVINILFRKLCHQSKLNQINQMNQITGRNLANIHSLFNLDPGRDPLSAFKAAAVGYQTTESDEWRLSFLRKLLAQRREFSDCEDDVSTVN